ncbi:MAG: hypothetical protein KBD65_00360 [Candidatus Moranbacteria bacterium]|nr:hypothetical protein [Candidatus Moranbacteria bacterium]
MKESILSSGGAGVAKIMLAEEGLIRAYGLFPHPNVLAGFLGITILLTMAYPIIFGRKMFHVEQSVLLYRLVLGIQVIGFLLTFSKGAFLGLPLAIGYFVYKMFHVEQFKTSLVGSEKNVPRGTIQDLFSWFRKKCSTWNIPKILLITITIGLFLGMVNWQYFFIQPFKERVFLEKGFFFILREHPFQGVGIGQSVFTMQGFFSEKLFSWQFQPVHNLFLLIFSETGLIGTLLFLSLLILIIVPRGTIWSFLNWIREKCSTWNNAFKISKMFHVEQLKNNETDLVENVPRGTIGDLRMKALLEAAILFLGAVSLFDHYLWDIQQGQLLFWLILGLFSSSRLLSYNIDK